MIDYDDLRRRWTQALESNKIAHYYTSASLAPEDGLRLLDIIAVAKWGLQEASVCNDDYHASKTALDEIAKLEKE